jgi:hypothetical protein
LPIRTVRDAQATANAAVRHAVAPITTARERFARTVFEYSGSMRVSGISD